MGKMKKEIVIVTGASSGIGFDAVSRLSAAGYEVIAGVRSTAAMEAWRGKRHVTPCLLDVTDTSAIEQAVATLAPRLAEASAVHLVNNAGIAVAGPVEAVPLAQWRAQFEVNVFGLVAVTQAFLPEIRRSGGRIVQVSSVSGLAAAPYLGPYASSKFAVEALSDSLRRELRQFGVKVILIEPGPVQTPIWEKGLARREAIFGALRSQVREFYDNGLEGFLASVARSAAEAVPVSQVSSVLLEALRSPSPRSRYVVGTPATRFFTRLLPLLPDRWVDSLIDKDMRQQKPR